MLLVAGMFSVIGVIQKAGILRSSPMLFAFAENVFVSLVMIPIMLIRRRTGFAETRTRLGPLVLLGFLMAMMFICQNTAMGLGPVAYVISIKRFSILLSVLAGCLLLGEGRPRERLIGSAVMICGGYCISQT